MFDLVIENARIYDGMGGPFYYSNVGIKDGTIARLSRLKLEGERRIDASGLSLCPGFIDPHGHADSMMDKEPRLAAKIEQGLTSNLGGLCGESPAPFRRADGSICLFSEYLEDLSRKPIGADLGLMVGAGTLRAAVMGFALDNPSPAQMEDMKVLLRNALQAGAFGLSFGLAYPPSSYFNTEEIAELCAVAAEYDAVAAFHLRNEGDYFEEGVEEALSVARRTGCRLILSHHKAVREPNWGKTAITLDMIDRAAEEGLEIYADAHPYTAVSAGLRMYIPRPLHAAGLPALTEQAGTKEGRAFLIRAMEETLAAGNGHYQATDVPRAYILSSDSHPEYNGRRVVEVAKEQGRSFGETLIDLLCEDHMRTMGMHVDFMSQQDVDRVLKHPRVMPCTDGTLILPGEACHPRTRGAFPRFLGRMCIRGGLLPMEAAIEKMTSLPARVYRMPGKGIIREGMDADLILFDPSTLCDNATVADCKKENSGLTAVILAGTIVAEDGKMGPEMKGRILRCRF